MAKAKTAAAVIRKKKWYPVVAPRLEDMPVGETPAFEAKSLVGRTLLANLMTLTNDPKKQHVNIKFMVTSANETQAQADPVGYYIMASSLKRLVRRRTDRVDDSILCETAEGIKIKIKPFMLTRNLVKDSIKTRLRKISREYLIKYAKQKSLIDLLRDIVDYKPQEELRGMLKRIYPLKALEIRTLEITKDASDERSLVQIVKELSAHEPESKAEVSAA
ncbi:hypothetical protein HYV81_01915 [Candidatus Woesearchaeota archaeon]|nr:hypothetical protein [Candidatus Woesearchaeota archaeon]